MDNIEYSYADKVKKEKQRYLWYPYMLDRNVNIIGGEAGTGKTWFLCALMAAVTTEQPEGMPGTVEKHGKVIYAGGEDGNSVMRERLEIVGADLSKIILIEKRFNALGEGFRELVDKEKPVLIVFDPLLSYVDEKSDANRYTVSRSLMDGIRDLARETNTSVVCVIHPPKKDEYRLIHRFTGSGGFVDAARAATYVGYHPSVLTKRVVIQPKNNAGFTTPTVFEIDPDGGFTWCGEDDTITMHDVEISHRESGKKADNLDSYVALIKKVLKSNSEGFLMTAKEMIDAVDKTDVNAMALGRALKKDEIRRRLSEDGIILTTGSRAGNRQRYSVKYE